MRVSYFSSDTHPFDRAIYPGVGPEFARPLGWPTEKLSRLADCNYDIAVIDNRLDAADVTFLRSFLERPSAQRRPIFFRVSDIEMPNSKSPNVKFIFDQRDLPGVHYALTYDPEGPMLDFVQSLRRSSAVHLPFAYDRTRELDADLTGRRRQLFFSGSQDRQLYPARYRLHQRRKWNPLLRCAVFELRHPGYPEFGPLRHALVRERFIAFAAGFTHFFLCGSRYDVELMKYVECAYARAVPWGTPAGSIKAATGRYFRCWSQTTAELLTDLRAPLSELQERADGYRAAMRQLRDPIRLVAEFEEQVSRRHLL